MVKRKGELSRRMIDLRWPHQVAIPAEKLFGGGCYTAHYFCDGLALCERSRRIRLHDREYVVFCFADPAHAELFRARFNGEMICAEV